MTSPKRPGNTLTRQENIAIRVFAILDQELYNWKTELYRVQNQIDYGAEDQRFSHIQYKNKILREIIITKEVINAMNDFLDKVSIAKQSFNNFQL